MKGESAPDRAGGQGTGMSNRSRRRVDPRLPAYLFAGFLGLLAALSTGRPELAAIGAPFLTLAALALVTGAAGKAAGEVTIKAARVIEGSDVEGVALVDWEGEAEVDVMLVGWRGITPLDPAPSIAWALPRSRGPVRLPFRVHARSWGVHSLGTLWVRTRRPGGLVAYEQPVAAGPTLRVLPAPTRLDRLLRPAEPRAIAGMHLSRLRGHGTDLADLRPYQPGDHLRDLSWGTSARLGEPWVTVHHPERTGTVLLLLDAFFGDDEGAKRTLARAARAAWAVASAHLRAQDQVGLLARGRTVAWVPPHGGRRARWLLLDELLSVGGAAEDTWRRRRWSRRVMVPADALVVGVTSLRSETFASELVRHRRSGQTTVALVIDSSDLLPEPRDRLDQAARRIWLARREMERQALERSGVPTALVRGRGGVGPAVASLRRRMSAARR